MMMFYLIGKGKAVKDAMKEHSVAGDYYRRIAAALGDLDLVRLHLDRDPGAIRTRVSDAWYPKRNPHAGGTILIWVLGANRAAHHVAREFLHEDVFRLLMERSPVELQLTVACELGDESAVQRLLASVPLTNHLTCAVVKKQHVSGAAVANFTV
jgi:hypothetical protein